MESKNNKSGDNKLLRKEYIFRINRVIDYIEKNIDEDLSLESLAKVADFSPFHFHRIFRALVGETLYQFIHRIRVERAAMKLVSQPRKSITDIAFDCGFSGSAAFARSFRETFNMSPSQWRSSRSFMESKNCKLQGNPGKISSKERKDFSVSFNYNSDVKHNLIWRIKMKETKKQIQVEVQDLPDLQVAYVRHIGPYQGDTNLFENLFRKLMTWAGPRGLLNFPETKCLTVYYDDPKVTDEDKLRTDVCITVPEDTEVSGEIGKTKIPGGKFAVAHCEISADEYGDAWNLLMGGWLPESGYQPDDRLCYELYLNNPKDHPENKHIVDICLPVKPL